MIDVCWVMMIAMDAMGRRRMGRKKKKGNLSVVEGVASSTPLALPA